MTSGKTHNEIERVYYLLLNQLSFDALKTAEHVEDHEQWSVKTPLGSVRVRSTDKANFSLTIKSANNETEEKIGKDAFEAFKAISENGMIKRRFTFPIDVESMSPFHRAYWRGLKWEVDVFFLPDGSYAPWCKVDLEVNTSIQKASAERPPLPIPYVKFLTDKPIDKEAVTHIYGKYFIVSK